MNPYAVGQCLKSIGAMADSTRPLEDGLPAGGITDERGIDGGDKKDETGNDDHTCSRYLRMAILSHSPPQPLLGNLPKNGRAIK